MVRFLVYILALLFAVAVKAQDGTDYMFNRIEVEKGLSNSEIRCIYKCSTGYIWFGTRYGLNRFDGYEVRAYKQNLNLDNTTLNNDIADIQEDACGRLWLSTRSGYAIFNPEKEQFEANPMELIHSYAGTDTISLAYIDLGKNFWFVTTDGVTMYETKSKKQNLYPFGGESNLSPGDIAAICQGQNRYWFLYTNGILECMDAQTRKVIMRDSTLAFNPNKAYDGQARLFSDSSGNIWVYGFMGKGAYCFGNNKIVHYHTEADDPAHRLSGDVVSGITEDENGQIWIAMDHGGINIFRQDSNLPPISLHYDSRNPNSIAQDAVKSLYIDNTGIVWVGTYKRGVCYYQESIFKFRTIKNRNNTPEMDVNCFIETPDGNIWIGSNNSGLLFYDRKRDIYIPYRHDPNNPNSPAGDIVVSMEMDNQGRLWIGYFLDGMDCWDGKRFTHYSYNPDNPDLLPDNNVWKLLCDRDDTMWIATLTGGVAVMDIQTGKRLYHFPDLGTVYSIIRRADGEILVGCLNGLFIFDSETAAMKPYEPEIFGKVHLSNYDINYLFEDSRRLLWIGTRNGLFVYNPFTKEVSLFTIKDGLSSDLIQSILEDSEHNMWVATNRGLTLIKVSTPDDAPGYFFKMSNYDQAEGLQGEQFNFNAAYMTSNREMIFGGSSGFNIFTPSAIHYNTNKPHVVLTDFQIYNESLSPGKERNGRIILQKSITYTDKIELDYTDDYFSIGFAALDYCMPDKSRYFYKLDGFNKQWMEASRDIRKVTYTNLPAGTYTFNIKAINNDGVESENPTQLTIIIHPPFWLTPLAYLVYSIILASIFYAYWKYSSRKSEQRVKFAEEKMRIEHQHDMDEMKLKFFTNISHEFRTPLTLILTPLEELIKATDKKETLDLLHIIRRNAQQLLVLVNQLLDFRKLDVRHIHLQPSLGDIVAFVHDTVSLFSEALEHKHITCTLNLPEEPVYMSFDADKIGKVLVNILSNAYKFTPEGGRISVSLTYVHNQEVRIAVEDNGIGIPSEALPHIFERFYQVEQKSDGYPLSGGSGIGLHLAKEFVLLHHGKIWAENVEGGGSRFIFTLPFDAGHPESGDEYAGQESDAGIQSGQESQPAKQVHSKLLIVDDNDDFRAFLSSSFSGQYTVIEARDGEEGLNAAIAELPDMIISDLMMPKMDGVQLCRNLKNDIRTSHIPFILLTAKTAKESEQEGLRAGADDYISKPFNLEALKLKIYNITEARHRRQQPLRKPNAPIEPSRITVTTLDEKLLKRVMDDVEANISNPNFSVEELSHNVGMSRVNLYKKILSITGKTPSEFIRLVRLKRAAQLLRESQMNVSEVAYEVGFNNPKYFRKYFKEEFGVLPSQFEKGEKNANE